MYRYFLAQVRKERTVVITPDKWSEMINPVAIDWVKTKLPESEFNQKRIDDLVGIKVITDNVQFASLPQIYDTGNIFRVPYSYPGYPYYLHGISAQFATDNLPAQVPVPPPGGGNPTLLNTSLQFIPKEHPDTLVGVIGGKIFRSDKRAMNKNNPYRQPDDTYVYFEQRGGFVYVTSKTVYKHMVLEYYAYPEKIQYDGDKTDISGSFQPAQNKEIMDMAVTQYLERVSDQRIQTQPQVSAQVPK